jgi:hypothetical protein
MLAAAIVIDTNIFDEVCVTILSPSSQAALHDQSLTNTAR